MKDLNSVINHKLKYSFDNIIHSSYEQKLDILVGQIVPILYVSFRIVMMVSRLEDSRQGEGKIYYYLNVNGIIPNFGDEYIKGVLHDSIRNI